MNSRLRLPVLIVGNMVFKIGIPFGESIQYGVRGFSAWGHHLFYILKISVFYSDPIYLEPQYRLRTRLPTHRAGLIGWIELEKLS